MKRAWLARLLALVLACPRSEASPGKDAGPRSRSPMRAPLQFRDRGEETRFPRASPNSCACVMCQNQSLADSNALIAQDLRARCWADARRQERRADQAVPGRALH
jgi:cytochrome c-type biogenesis protein CcmH/NrfF